MLLICSVAQTDLQLQQLFALEALPQCHMQPRSYNITSAQSHVCGPGSPSCPQAAAAFSKAATYRRCIAPKLQLCSAAAAEAVCHKPYLASGGTSSVLHVSTNHVC
jgi:hypothetical protein